MIFHQTNMGRLPLQYPCSDSDYYAEEERLNELQSGIKEGRKRARIRTSVKPCSLPHFGLLHIVTYLTAILISTASVNCFDLSHFHHHLSQLGVTTTEAGIYKDPLTGNHNNVQEAEAGEVEGPLADKDDEPLLPPSPENSRGGGGGKEGGRKLGEVVTLEGGGGGGRGKKRTSRSFYGDSGNPENSDVSSSSAYHLFHDKHRVEPFFDNTTARNITTSSGKTVYLPCRVHHLSDKTVSWIRRKNLNVLTVGKFAYTSDQRFQPVHLEGTEDWLLQVEYPQKEDAGVYECQISTSPKKSLFVTLNVVVSKAKIIGGPSLYINSGSTLSLTCTVNETPGPPDYIFWYHNGQVINYTPRGIKVQTEKSAQATSKLIINKAQASDSGNYSCVPSNAEPANIDVHVLNNDGNPAAMQHGKRSAGEFISSGTESNQKRKTFLLLFSFLFIFNCHRHHQFQHQHPLQQLLLQLPPFLFLLVCLPLIFSSFLLNNPTNLR